MNGTRGKSSVTRLIAAGLRSGGIKTFAKTTGSSPRFIGYKGNDHIIQRFTSASIGEQIRMIRKFSKKKPNAIVLECMAVQPQYQWVSEHKIVQSNYSVITNVKADHLEEMGYSLDHIAKSLSNTIPSNQQFFTSETKCLEPFIAKTSSSNTTLNICLGKNLEEKYLENFSYIEHPDNIALALDVCESIGVSKEIAIKGMRTANSDPGALKIIKIKINDLTIDFVNAFAANDPQSTKTTIELIESLYKKNKKIVLFLNTRHDRKVRTQQLLDFIFNELNPNHLLIRGDNLESDIKNRCENIKKLSFTLIREKEEMDSVLNSLVEFENALVIGIGNIVGWGENFIDYLKEYQDD